MREYKYRRHSLSGRIIPTGNMPTLDELKARASVIVGHGSQPRKGSWRWRADGIIGEAHDAKGSALTDAEIRDLYPWGERKYLPYKMWLAAKKAYRARFGHPTDCA